MVPNCSVTLDWKQATRKRVSQELHWFLFFVFFSCWIPVVYKCKVSLCYRGLTQLVSNLLCWYSYKKKAEVAKRLCHFEVKLLPCSNNITICGSISEFLFQMWCRLPLSCCHFITILMHQSHWRQQLTAGGGRFGPCLWSNHFKGYEMTTSLQMTAIILIVPQSPTT